MGESRFVKLFQNMDYQELLSTDKEVLKNKIITLEGFADGIANSLVDELETRKPEITELLNYIKLNPTPKLDKNKQLYTIVVTGSFKGYKDVWNDRKSLEKYLKGEGHTVSGSVSSKTTYLINNDINSTSGKNAEAKKLNVKIITEEEFSKILFPELNQEIGIGM
jgi:DNA ligase (NAD+)